MSLLTLAEAAKLTQNELIEGVAETITVTDQFYEFLPFDTFEGPALTVVQETTMGAAAPAGVNADLRTGIYTDAAVNAQVSFSLTKIIGQAEVDNLIRLTQSNVNDQMAVQVESKAKNIGLQYRDQLINGSGTSNEMLGLIGLAPAGSKTTTTGANGSTLTFDYMDQVMYGVTDNNEVVDFFQMSTRTMMSYRALLRAMGGNTINEIYTLPSGGEVPTYSGVPIFRNNNIPLDQTKGTSTTCTSIIAGTRADASRKIGIAGLTSSVNAGINLQSLGTLPDKDSEGARLVFYCGLALFNPKGVYIGQGITN